MTNEDSGATSVFRIDRFSVPAGARTQFMKRLRRIQQLLSTMPGCRQNLVLAGSANPSTGNFDLMTVVEWANTDAMAAAKVLVQKKYAQEGFDPAGFMQDLGVRPDFGIYSVAPPDTALPERKPGISPRMTGPQLQL